MSEFETQLTLLQRVKDPGDSQSWQEFVDLYQPLLLRFVISRGVPESDAQDIVQEIFATLLRSLPSFELDHRRGRFRTWLWNVSRNVMVDCARRFHRRKKAEQNWVERLAELRNTEDSQALWCQAHKKRVLEFVLERVRAASQTKTWTCFEEHIRKGRPAAEIATELELTANAVYVNASRTLQRIRDQCAEYGEALDDE